jgi:hypothetical protein
MTIVVAVLIVVYALVAFVMVSAIVHDLYVGRKRR